MSQLFWYFVVFTVLGQAHFAIYPGEAQCRLAREGIMVRLPDGESLTTPCVPATREQLEGLGFRLPRPPSPPIQPEQHQD